MLQTKASRSVLVLEEVPMVEFRDHGILLIFLSDLRVLLFLGGSLRVAFGMCRHYYDLSSLKG